ncbi:MAG: transposase [Desulfobacula sp.]|nr:transposase [Desulfobacula sp.]
MNPMKYISEIPEDEISPTVSKLIDFIQQQAEELQALKDEISRLKGQKTRPKIKPSNLDGKTKQSIEERKKNPLRKKRSKTKTLVVHEEKELHPENLPQGSTFIDYKDYCVQDLIFTSWNIMYRRGRWKTVSGEYITADLPENINGHFGADLQAYILYQYYGCHVTQPLIFEQLTEMGVDISKGKINDILIHGKSKFHAEKDQILSTGLSLSGHINVDDTGARHDGHNGYCTHIGNEYFAWFKSTQSKSRINFLKLLTTGRDGYILNEDALEYMQIQKLPKAVLEKLHPYSGKLFETEKHWAQLLESLGIENKRHLRIAIEGGLIGNLIHHGYNKNMAIVSDDAGQFNIFLHALCWVHAERTIHKLVGFTPKHTALQEKTRSDIWGLYRALKEYQTCPSQSQKKILESQFDELFTRKTEWVPLNEALQRIYNNKSELLLVLSRPDIPLHNNLSENDIREYVKRRKISGSTRSDSGKLCRDSFTSLKKTCRKLGISFWEYLQDRIHHRNQIPPLWEIMALQISNAHG